MNLTGRNTTELEMQQNNAETELWSRHSSVPNSSGSPHWRRAEDKFLKACLLMTSAIQKRHMVSPSSSQTLHYSSVPEYLLFSQCVLDFQFFRSQRMSYFTPEDFSLRFFSCGKSPIEVFMIPQLKGCESLLFIPIIPSLCHHTNTN